MRKTVGFVAVCITASAFFAMLAAVGGQIFPVFNSVVYLEVPNDANPNAIGLGDSGTGFIIASDDAASYIVTAAHVIKCDTYGLNCLSNLDVRLQNDPAVKLDGQRVYAGASTPDDDYALIRVSKGKLPLATVGDARAGEAIGALGYPESFLTSLHGHVPSPLSPLSCKGTLTTVADNGDRVVMKIETTHGYSGGPIFDAASGTVVGIVHGASGDGPSEDRFAIGPRRVRQLATMLNSQMALSGNADDASVLAHVLFQNAAYASRRWNYLAFTRHVLITSDQMQRLNSQVANLYGRAVAAGSIEAAVVLANSLDRTYLIGAPPALELLDHETMKGSAIAPLALARYFEGQAAHPDTYAGLPQSAKPVDDGKRYLHLAADRGNPFAMNDVANAYALQKAPQDEKIWRDRANAAFEHEAAAGDAGAAFAYGENLTLYAHDGDPLERRDRIVAAFRRAADLGAPRAIESLAIWFKPGDAAEDAELFRRSRASVDAGQTNNAVLLGSLYEGGRGTPRDPTAALRAYALGYQIDIGAPESPLQAKLNGLEPDGASIAQRLPTSPGYASAKATSARLHVPGAQRWGGNEVAGVVVRSDGKRAVIATAAFNLGCDSFSGSCATPDSVEIGPSQTKYTSVRIVRKADTSVENGVVLLTVAAPNAPSAGVAETIPARVMTLAYEGPTASMQGMLRQPTRSYWGLIVGTSPDRRVLQLVLPTEGATGSGIFDLETGKLVGMYTDPFSLEATGPTTLLRALREASTNAN